MIDFERLWSGAMPFHTFITESTAHKGLWDGVCEVAAVAGIGLSEMADC